MPDLEFLHGQPSADEIAAVVVALTPVATTDDDPDGGGHAGTPAWTQAALLEGIGGATVARPADLVPQPAAPSVGA